MRPLKLRLRGSATQEEMRANVEATLARGYIRINEYLGQFSGRLSICGSAPSLADTYQNLDGDIIAVNAALGFLLERNIVPRFAMLWDASEVIEKFAIPHPDITYFVAARCHPFVFEKLAGCRLISWFAGGDHNIFDLMREKKINEPTINGGSAGVTRAMYLGMALGYTDLQLHGADSSYKGNQTHITKSLAVETAIPVHVNGTTFYSTPGWCAQVDEFRRIYVGYRDKINIKVHGDGLLPYVYRHISDPSLKCTWESSEEQSPPEQKQPWWKSIFGLYRDLVGAH